jgi:hypothetical protein
MDTDLFTFKILPHKIYLDDLIFSPSFLAIERPGFSVRLFNYPVFLIYGKKPITKAAITKNHEVKFGEGKSSSFEMNINELQNLFDEIPLMINFLETANNHCKILGKVFLNLNVFKDDIKHFFDDDKDNWKRKMFMLHDEVQNVIGKIDVSITLTRKRKALMTSGPQQVERGLTENIDPNTFGRKQYSPESKPILKPKKIEREMQTHEPEATFIKQINSPRSPGMHDNTTVQKSYEQPSNQSFNNGNRTVFSQLSNSTQNRTRAASAHGKKIQIAPPTQHDDPINIKTSYMLETQMPTLKNLVDGYFCPPIMLLKKKKEPMRVLDYDALDAPQQRTTKYAKTANKFAKSHIEIHSPFIKDIDAPGGNNFSRGDPQRPQTAGPVVLLSNESSNQLINLQNIQNIKNSGGVLEMLINELVNLKLQQQGGPINSQPESARQTPGTAKLGLGPAATSFKSPGPAKGLSSFSPMKGNESTQKSKVKIQHPIQETKEDDSYSDSFESLSVSQNISHIAPPKKTLKNNSSIAPFNKKINPQQMKDIRASISESYPDDFDLVSASQSQLPVMKYVECYVCFEKIEQNKASEHAKKCKKTAIRRSKNLEDSGMIAEDIHASNSFSQSVSRSAIKDSLQRSESKISEKYDEDFDAMSETN